MVSFIDCHLSLRRCSPFNGGKFEGWGTSFCWWPNRIGYLCLAKSACPRQKMN